MPANRATSRDASSSRNRNKGKSAGASEARAPNRRQARRMQANGLSSRKPRRPAAAADASKQDHTHRALDSEEGEEDAASNVPAQQTPDKNSWAAKMHSIDPDQLPSH